MLDLISNNREWNKYFIKNNQKTLLHVDLADLALQEQPEGNLMVAISLVWYNGSYTMAAKPIKSLELHYTMIQLLIILVISWLSIISHPTRARGIIVNYTALDTLRLNSLLRKTRNI